MFTKRKTVFWTTVLILTCLIVSPSRFTRSEPSFGELAAFGNSSDASFIAAFDWTVDLRPTFVWPVDAVPPAPYKAVWVVVERMPRAWVETRRHKPSTTLSASECLRVNGRPLPKPRPMTESREAFRVLLSEGRLRFSFLLPPGRKLDSSYNIVRIRLYRSINSRERALGTAFVLRAPHENDPHYSLLYCAAS